MDGRVNTHAPIQEAGMVAAVVDLDELYDLDVQRLRHVTVQGKAVYTESINKMGDDLLTDLGNTVLQNNPPA